MAFGTRVQFNPIGEVAFGSIGASYGAFGAPMPGHARIIRFSNSTNTDIYVSADGVNNHLRIAANSFALFDFSTNRIQDDGLFVQKGDQFYIKYATAPGSGSAWIEVITAAGGV
jgi:hypothetical protein